jgi:hypothetical protein
MKDSFRFSTILIPAVGLLIGAMSAVMVWGRNSEEYVQLTERLDNFRQLTDEQQHLVRLSFDDFREQSPTRRAEITEIFETSRRDPQFRKALDRYYNWWSSLSREDWDHFREMSDQARLAFVRSSLNLEQEPQKEIVIEFPGREPARIPELHLTFEEYSTIIQEALAAAKKPDSVEQELAALSSDKHRALRLTLWMFDDFPSQRDSAEMRARGQKFVAALLKNVRDEEWKNRFSTTLKELKGMSFEQAWLFMTLFTILDRSTVTLGNDLREEFPVTQQQIIDAFASLEDKALQHSLMIMSREEAKTRLELLAQTENAQTPEQQLLARYNRFARDRRRIMPSVFGFGGLPRSGPAVPIPVPGDDRRILPPNGRR